MTRSEQARADALADAATLRDHTASLLGGGSGWLAAEHGRRAERFAYRGDVDRAGEFAQAAARAAFRAVPGLRGDR